MGIDEYQGPGVQGHDVLDDLVAPHTVSTMPEGTIRAVADHGDVGRDTTAGTYDDSRAVLADLAKLGISYVDVVDVVGQEGVNKFFNRLSCSSPFMPLSAMTQLYAVIGWGLGTAAVMLVLCLHLTEAPRHAVRAR